MTLTKNYRPQTGAARAAQGTFSELHQLAWSFDNGNHSVARTMSMLCNRLLDELEVCDPDGKLPFFSFVRPKIEGTGRYIAGSCKVFRGFKIFDFECPDEAIELPEGIEKSDVVRHIERSRWISEKIYIDILSQKNKISRYDVLHAFRNQVGAHFDSQVSDYFPKLLKPDTIRLTLSGGPNSKFEDSSIKVEELSTSFAVENWVRMITAELFLTQRSQQWSDISYSLVSENGDPIGNRIDKPIETELRNDHVFAIINKEGTPFLHSFIWEYGESDWVISYSPPVKKRT